MQRDRGRCPGRPRHHLLSRHRHGHKLHSQEIDPAHNYGVKINAAKDSVVTLN